MNNPFEGNLSAVGQQQRFLESISQVTVTEFLINPIYTDSTIRVAMLRQVAQVEV
ncbi:hypothetical protein [Streptomyces sp. PD-S100-1]|uniref:hypothetical protein n=1 Tax=Streptomyces sp. PD-S100-1 TaxID=3394351 RepID=UPI0039BD7490